MNATIGYELRKNLIQFLLIGALGAVVAFLVDDAKRRADAGEETRRKDREAAERRRRSAVDLATSLLARLDETYADVKRTRRAVRRTPGSELSRDAYIDIVVSLIDGEKAEFEKLWHEMRDLQDLMPELRNVWPSVNAMEDYLRPMEDEMESILQQTRVFDAATLRKLSGFRAKTVDSISTFSKFRDHYHEARHGLVVLIASRRSGTPAASV
jgi:hypothetical protein